MPGILSRMLTEFTIYTVAKDLNSGADEIFDREYTRSTLFSFAFSFSLLKLDIRESSNINFMMLHCICGTPDNDEHVVDNGRSLSDNHG